MSQPCARKTARSAIVEIGDPRQHRHRDGDRSPGGAKLIKHHRLLGGQLPRGGQPRDHAQPRPACATRDLGIAIIEQPHITAKLADHKAPDHRGIAFVDPGLGADDDRHSLDWA
jgi:hypothetical protein